MFGYMRPLNFTIQQCGFSMGVSREGSCRASPKRRSGERRAALGRAFELDFRFVISSAEDFLDADFDTSW